MRNAITAKSRLAQLCALAGLLGSVLSPTHLWAAASQEAPPAVPVAEGKTHPRLLHVPVAQEAAGQAIVVVASFGQGQVVDAKLQLHYRRRGASRFEVVPFGLRDPQTWTALIPESATGAGTVEYYISARPQGDGQAAEQFLFASPAWPHPVALIIDEGERRQRQLLAQHMGNRSQFRFAGLYVDRGMRKAVSSDGRSTRDMRDYFYRLEGDYTYRILSGVYSIRIGGGVLRGDSFLLQDPLPVYVDKVGLTYGFAEVRFRFGRLVRMDLRATLGAGPQHFDGGGGGQLLIGLDPGTHFAVGADGVSSVGLRAWVRLAWNTVPHVPMSFTLEASNLPLGVDFGGLMYLTLGYRPSRYFSFDLNAGYAHRDKAVGGPIAGLALKVEF